LLFQGIEDIADVLVDREEEKLERDVLVDCEDEKLECGTPIRARKGVLKQSAIRSVVCKLICIYPLLSRN